MLSEKADGKMAKAGLMPAYYNENDAKAAAWLRELIARGLVADGVVDERSITKVTPDDIKEFTQCHFFAGIGVWSYALRQAGWPDSRPVWTGSCPCQPFSAAGKGAGFDDERHLWPVWFGLVRESRPDVIFGEQVASKSGLGWFDALQTDLETENYACGAVDTCAAGVGAPHIRQRLYFAAERLGDGIGAGLERHAGHVDDRNEPGRIDAQPGRPIAEAGSTGGLEDSACDGSQRGAKPGRSRQTGSRRLLPAGPGDDASWLADTDGRDSCAKREQPGRQQRSDSENRGALLEGNSGSRAESIGDADGPGPTNGYWRDADWLGCRDGKWRPVESGTFPLVNGAPARVVRLRGYGNAINAEQARAFIESYIEITREKL